MLNSYDYDYLYNVFREHVSKMIMVQVCIQGNNLNIDELPALPTFHAVYHEVTYIIATSISLISDMILAWMIRNKTVPQNNVGILVSPELTDPTRLPLVATVLSALAFMPVVVVIGMVLSIQGIYVWF